MTQDEYNEAAALVVRLRKDLELHTDALKQSNAQCAEYLRQNEQLTAELDRMKGDPLPIKLVGKLKDAEDSNKTLHSELVEVRSALASVTEQRDSLRRTLDEWARADTAPHERVTADDVADHVVPPVLDMCMTCHECGSSLRTAGSPVVWHCRNERCSRRNTAWIDDESPYHGPCKSATQVRHE